MKNTFMAIMTACTFLSQSKANEDFFKQDIKEIIKQIDANENCLNPHHPYTNDKDFLDQVRKDPQQYLSKDSMEKRNLYSHITAIKANLSSLTHPIKSVTIKLMDLIQTDQTDSQETTSSRIEDLLFPLNEFLRSSENLGYKWFGMVYVDFATTLASQHSSSVECVDSVLEFYEKAVNSFVNYRSAGKLLEENEKMAYQYLIIKKLSDFTKHLEDKQFFVSHSKIRQNLATKQTELLQAFDKKQS